MNSAALAGIFRTNYSYGTQTTVLSFRTALVVVE